MKVNGQVNGQRTPKILRIISEIKHYFNFLLKSKNVKALKTVTILHELNLEYLSDG